MINRAGNIDADAMDPSVASLPKSVKWGQWLFDARSCTASAGRVPYPFFADAAGSELEPAHQVTDHRATFHLTHFDIPSTSTKESVMAIPHASAGMPVDLHLQGESFAEATTQALIKNETFEAIRLVIPAGREICNNHRVDGTLTLHCLEGQITFAADSDVRPMRAGQWLFLPGGVPHTIVGVEDALVLLTVMF